MKTILAIYDQQDNLTTIQAIIKNNMPDCQVITALLGKDGIKIAREEQPDTILLDIIMDGMDGYGICKRLKEDKLTKHIPVVMITATETDAETRFKALGCGADAFLSKPIDPIELSAQVNIMLRIKEVEDKLRAGDKEKEHNKNIELLSKTAMRFVDFPLDRNIYAFIGEQLQDLIGKNSYVFVNSIDTGGKILITRAIIGMGKISEKVANLIGKNPIGMTFDIKNEELVYLSDGKLHLYKSGLYGITLKTIPKTVASSIEKLLNIKSIFTIGFTKGNKLFGTIGLILQEDVSELKNKQIIEAFIKQASIAVQKRQAEEALKESNEDFNQVVSNIPNVVWKADIGENGVFENTYSSPVLDELLELPAGTMKNDWDKYFSYIKPEYLERVNNAFGGAIKSPGKQINCEYEVLKDNGQTAWFHSTGRCFEKNGKLHVFGSTADITERKQMEEAILKSEEKYRLLTETAGDSILLHDMDGQILYANRVMIENIGYSYKELLEMSVQDIVPKDKLKQLLENQERRKNKNFSRFIFEIEIVTKKGKRIPVEIASSPFIKDEKVTALFIIARDITERKQAEEALKVSEEKYRLLADNSIDLVWQMNLKLVFTYVSPSVETITGYTVDECIGTRLSQFSRSKEFFNMAKKALYAIKQHKKFKYLTFEAVVLHKNGIEIPVEITGKLLYNKKGLPEGLQGTTHDITGRVQAKEVLKKKMNELEIFNTAAVGREFKVLELKKEINELLAKCGKEPKYEIPV